MASESRKPPSRLAEKGQHLDPLKPVGAISGEGDMLHGSGNGSASGASKHKNGSGAGCNSVDVGNNVAGKCAASEDTPDTGSGSIPYRNFKMGADSIDITDITAIDTAYYYYNTDGLLSPKSPTSPTSPSSEDGRKSPLKSSMRDPSRAKTPPGTPNKKSVRFADALGLDLETVKTILRTESPPDLNVHVDEERQTISAKVLSLCFQQPGGKPDFLPRLYVQNICLENVVVHEMTLIGTIKVRNLGFDKAVRIRHSSDNWKTYVDVMAMYVQGSCDGPTDRFSFGLSRAQEHDPRDHPQLCHLLQG